MQALLDRWHADLAARPATVVLTDGDDPRTIAAARQLAGTGLVTPLVLAPAGRAAAGVELLDPREAAADERIAACLDQALSGRRMTEQDRAEAARDPLYLGAAAVRAGLADGVVGGSARPTSQVIRAALRVIGLATGVATLSSCFLMVLGDGRVLAYADCAVIPQPDQKQLAEIAISTSATFSHLTGQVPAVAMLSFSTKGSADHDGVQLVRAATELARRRAPELAIDGELQFDAAFIAAVGTRKAPGSPVAGRANVYVFPGLDAGNIGYKITERLAGAAAIGPILQGLAAPMNDLSRGCSVSDIAMVATVSAVQAVKKAAVPAASR